MVRIIKKPSELLAARAPLEKAVGDLGDPGRLGDLRNAIHLLLRVMSGVSPQSEKDIAKKLVLICRNKVLSEVKVILANFDSYEPGSLEHWNRSWMFVNAGLAMIWSLTHKEQLLTRRGSNLSMV
jgi:hypothetical protein